MNKKLIGLISVFILAEIVCIIGYNIQSALRYALYPLCTLGAPNCTIEHMMAYNRAENEKVFAWVRAFFNIAYIFMILLTILISLHYYQKKKSNSSIPLETQGMGQ